MIELGSKVKDSVSGFTGIATARCTFLYGCSRICIEPMKTDKDGKLKEGVYFDEQRVVVLEKRKVFVSPDSVATSGGPQRDPTRARTP